MRSVSRKRHIKFARTDAGGAFRGYAQQFLMAGNPMTGADYQDIMGKSVAVAKGEYSPLAKAIASALYDALAGLLKYL